MAGEPVSTYDPSTGTSPGASAASHLREELESHEALLHAQTRPVQLFLEAQSRQLAQALVDRSSQVRFTLPDQVMEVTASGKAELAKVPAEQRAQMAGGLADRLARSDIRAALRQRFAELEQSSSAGVTASARLVRHATAMHMVHAMLPAGRSVTYLAPEGEGIPCLPVADSLEPASAIMASTDAIAEEGAAEAGRGELQVPYVPYARRFYLPQWVAFDESDRLLVGSISEAEAHIGSMQRFLGVLHAAVSLAPYIVADEEYQRKRYGMLGQLVNQGRALTRTITREIVQTIQRRAAANDLNRGLSLSLPYFDDQELEIRVRDIEVIPAGRIMFVPAFVVRAVREESAKVAQDTRLDPATRRHLLDELWILEQSFSSPETPPRIAALNR